MTDKHIPVLLHEVIELLDPKPGKNYIDATLGFGGHSEAILSAISPNGKLLGIDQDEDVMKYTKERLQKFGDRFTTVIGNFSQIDEIGRQIRVTGGILADIGVSSYQLDTPERGFSFRDKGPLDMRMDQSSELTASMIVNTYSGEEITKIIRDFGEERFAKRIATRIVEARKTKHLETTKELAEIVSAAIPRKFWPDRISPATKTFQAIRMAVNDELGSLEMFLPEAVEILQPGARLAVITFHSLEDKIVKGFMTKSAKPCTCPPEFPKCICEKKAKIVLVTRKPVVATTKEISSNPRSRSAKLRVIEKI